MEKSPSLRYKKDIDMRTLFLTLMLSFVSHGAFGAAEGGRVETKKGRTAGDTNSFFPDLLDVLLTEVGVYCSREEVEVISKSNPLLKGARETMAQEGFILNMEDIEEKDIESLTK